VNQPLPADYDGHYVTSIDDLETIYEKVSPAALIKEINYISDHYRAFIEKSPFMVVATSGPGGLDCSPRGDPAGFVRVVDSETVLLPDRRGNNRLDTLRNLVNDPRAALLFLIPGIGETLRINGRGYIVTEPELLKTFEMQGKIPTSVIMFKAERVYFQCSKALMRSRLWQTDSQISRQELPTNGEILAALAEDFDGPAFDKAYPERLKQTIY